MDVALELERQQGHPVQPDELFVVTHKNKKGDRVDAHTQQTYEDYQERLRAMMEHSSQGSRSGPVEVDAASKLKAWSEATGGRHRGRVYDTGDLAANFRKGVTSLTQSLFGGPSSSSSSAASADNEYLRRELDRAHQRAEEVTQRAEEATQRAEEAVEAARHANEQCGQQ